MGMMLRVSVYERRPVDVHLAYGGERQPQRQWIRQRIVLTSRDHTFVVGSVSSVIASAALAPIRLDRCLQLLLSREILLLLFVRVQILHIPVGKNMIKRVHTCGHLISVICSNKCLYELFNRFRKTFYY